MVVVDDDHGQDRGGERERAQPAPRHTTLSCLSRLERSNRSDRTRLCPCGACRIRAEIAEFCYMPGWGRTPRRLQDSHSAYRSAPTIIGYGGIAVGQSAPLQGIISAEACHP